MDKYILFDFDGTLLYMDLNEYLKEYFKVLSVYCYNKGFDGKEIASCAGKAILESIADERNMLVEEKFWEHFEKLSQYKKSDLETILIEFYNTDFNKIKELTKVNIDAQSTIEALKKKGYKIILATNPVYPLIATVNRIKWAGLNIEDFEYITSYENSKYNKPNLNYYKELIEKFNIDPKQTFMVGNDAYEDMISEQLGFKTYLVTDCLLTHKEYQPHPLYETTFSKLKEFILK